MKGRDAAFLVLAAAVFAALWAHSTGEGPAGRGDGPTRRARESGAAPLRLHGDQLYVEARVDGAGPFPFLLDTGATVTVVDRALADSLGLRVRAGGRLSGAGRGALAAGVAPGSRVTVGGLTAGGPGVTVAPVDSAMSGYTRRRVAGIVGYPFFRGRTVELDPAAGRLRVHDPSSFVYRGDGHVLPLRVDRGWPHLGAMVELPGGERLPVELVVDLGAGPAVVLSSPFVERHDLLGRLGAGGGAREGAGVGGSGRFRLVRLPGLRAGELSVEGLTAALAVDGTLDYRRFDGVLGWGLLRRYRVLLDYRGERLVLEPRNHRDGRDGR